MSEPTIEQTPGGAVTGVVRGVLQTEGFAIFLAAVALYFNAHYSWQLFALLFLVPDLSMLGYLAGRRIGAVAYNLAHSYVGPVALGAYGVAAGHSELWPIVMIWIAHVGFDRMLGYGLKYATGFGHTHLGRIGRAAKSTA